MSQTIFLYIKTTRQESVKYYQKKKKEKLKKKSLVKGTKIFLKKKNNKKIEYSHKRNKNFLEDENKSLLSIEKCITKSEKKLLLDKVSVSRSNSKNGIVLRWFRFRAIRIGLIGKVLAQSDTFETKCIEFLCEVI